MNDMNTLISGAIIFGIIFACGYSLCFFINIREIRTIRLQYEEDYKRVKAAINRPEKPDSCDERGYSADMPVLEKLAAEEARKQ